MPADVSTPAPLRLHMASDEKELFAAFLKASRSYVEFGSGGSTVFAPSLVKGSIVSLDSSREWLERVRAICAQYPDWVQPTLVHADIGPTREWGQPADESCRDRWPLYATSIWQTEGTEDADLYLIDGRFRVSCFMETLLRCRGDAILLIHDFAARGGYHVVREFAREIARSSELSAFVRRQDFDREMAARIIVAKKFEPD